MKKIVILTGGKFNRVHAGHKWLLKKAKKLGYLVVVIAHDKHNKKPYALPAKQRKKEVEKLRIADKVIVGSPTSFVSTVKKVRPHVIVLGYDQSLPKGLESHVKRKKIAILKFRKHGKYSTRKLRFA